MSGREREKERESSIISSFPRWLSYPKLNQAKPRNLIQVGHVGSRAQILGLSFTTFPDTSAGTGLKEGQLGLVLMHPGPSKWHVVWCTILSIPKNSISRRHILIIMSRGWEHVDVKGHMSHCRMYHHFG